MAERRTEKELRLLCAFNGVEFTGAPPAWWTEAHNKATREAWARVTEEAKKIVRETRAVPDEEVANIIRQGINAYYDDANSTAGMAESAIKALRAAGFTVVRTEARDGCE